MVGLASLVQQELQRDPFSGIMFVFRCKRADRIKLLLWDGTGLVLVTKRLETGTFRWPRFGDGVMSLTAAQASALIEGLDWARVHAPRVARPRSEEHTSELQSLMRISYAVFCLKTKMHNNVRIIKIAEQ